MHKTIYFVRHGQSVGNASLMLQQTGETVLTKRGMRQAKEVAQHLARLPIEALISSTFSRARMTAAEISSATGLPVTFSDLFVERRRPGVQLTKRKTHPHWLATELRLRLFGTRAGYRHSDEENAEDLLARAHAALQYLEAMPQSVIVVVTHKTFLRALHAVMTYGEGVTGRTYVRATRRMHLKNTALMIATYEEGSWNVRVWNADARTL